MIATTRLSSPFMRAATAMPSAALIEVLECAVPKVSYSLSMRRGNPATPAVLSQRRHPLPPPGENLMGVVWWPTSQTKTIMRRIEYIVQRHGELDRAEIGRQVAAGVRHRMNQVVTQFPGEPASCLRSSARTSDGLLIFSQKFVHAVTEFRPPQHDNQRVGRSCPHSEEARPSARNASSRNSAANCAPLRDQARSRKSVFVLRILARVLPTSLCWTGHPARSSTPGRQTDELAKAISS